MKILKRLLCMVLVAMLATTTLAIAFAQNHALPDPAKDGNSSITVHKYGVDASYFTDFIADGKEINNDTIVGSKTDENDEEVNVKLGDLIPLENIKFMLQLVKATLDVDGNTIYEIDNTFEAITKSTDENGILIFDNLAFGVYLISELDNNAVSRTVTPFYVSVPMSNPLAPDEWIYDIHVYPKNEIEGPDIDKSVSYYGNQHDTVDLATPIKWIITSEIPADIAASKEYVISDDLHDILRYTEVPNALEISFVHPIGGNKILLNSGSDYVLTYDELSSVYPWGGSLKIEITAAGRLKLSQALPEILPEELPRLTVEFYTIIDVPAEELENFLGEAIENQAKLKYVNSANVTYTPESEIPEVHLGGLKLKKVDVNGNILGGAEFKIYRSEADALNGENAILDPYDSSKEWIVTSDETTGLATFLGLAYGAKADESNEGGAYDESDAHTTYWIVEVKAPIDVNDNKPYNLLKEPLEVEVNAISHDDLNIINVVNSKFSLPLTGGAGTLLLTVGGLLLLGTGLFILTVYSKKRKSEFAL